MSKLSYRLLVCLLAPGSLLARLEPSVCGTHSGKMQEELFLHRQAARRGESARLHPRDAARGAAAAADVGQIAIIEDSDGVIGRRNPFDLDLRTLRFTPVNAAAASYRFETADASYDAAAAAAGTLVQLKDDDSAVEPLPFSFPFFGVSYNQIYVNSDGNLTFTGGDSASTDRSLGRLTAGLPRIAPLFTDLDPSTSTRGVFVTSEAGRFVVSWVSVPVFSDTGLGSPQTFQARLYPDGRIEFTWVHATAIEAVVGIAPGRLQNGNTVTSFTAGSTQEYAGAVAERFSATDAVDIVTAAQKFYQTHEDAYDYLVIYNTEGVPSAPGAVAFEVTVRNQRTGFGDPTVDVGGDFGSPRRLQAVLNMGPLTQYPIDPQAVVPARVTAGDTSLSVLGHETGHLFLAFASVPDPSNPTARPMLGRQLAHWSFLFNSEASLLEGNRIRDNGSGASPRFTTTATVEAYAPLDQYLMGFRAPEEVPPTFLVTNSPTIPSGSRSPQRGVSFDGARRDVSVQDVINAVGRRTPDSTVAQRRFRFAFLLVVPAGSAPPADRIAQLETYRGLFEGFYASVASGRATADPTLKRALRLSSFPAAGVLLGSAGTATLTIDTPPAAPLTVLLRAESGAVAIPASVTVAAGASLASFPLTGMRAGVDSITAEPSDSSYETAFAKIQVAGNAGGLSLAVIGGDKQRAIAGTPLNDPIVFQLLDINRLPYSGVPVRVAVTGGGTADAPSTTDENGAVRIRWTPGAGPVNELKVSVDGGPSAVAVALGQPSSAPDAVVNAASYAAGITPGAIATLFGANLVDGDLTINGSPARVFFVNNTQMNFYVPAGLTGDAADLVITTPVGVSPPVRAPVVQISPGIFAAVTRGAFAEIYSTGLGPLDAQGRTSNPVRAFFGATEGQVVFAGLAPGFLGLYQVNAQLPQAAGSGVSLTVAGKTSNTVPLY